MQKRLQTIAVIIAFAAVTLLTVSTLFGLRGPRDSGSGKNEAVTGTGAQLREGQGRPSL